MDVGQGDALLVTLPNGRTLMVDSGGVSLRGEFDIGDRVLGPALRARGIAGLDYLAVTHGDPDHIGGAWSLARDFSPHRDLGRRVCGHPRADRSAARGRRRAAVGMACPSGRRSSACRWRRIARASSAAAGLGAAKGENDDSLVIELRYGQVSMLLTGDIGREVERALIATLDLLPIVVLKSPHHGSGTSSSAEFVDAIRPKLVVISCGRGNPYGHPLPYVLDRYRNVNADVFRTDQDGQIEVVTDGASVQVSTFTGRSREFR